MKIRARIRELRIQFFADGGVSVISWRKSRQRWSNSLRETPASAPLWIGVFFTRPEAR
jgi:hypothetical protein